MNNDEYLLIKTDKNMTVCYANQSALVFSVKEEVEVIGQMIDKILPFTSSKTLWDFGKKEFDRQGFYNGYIKVKASNGIDAWFFLDMGKRYSPEGEWLGYEYMVYPAVDEGISRFSQLDDALVELENKQSLEHAERYMMDFVQSLGCGYDEYVCRLQAL